jgi:hypothetical protein
VLQPVVTESEPTNFFVRLGQVVSSQDALAMSEPGATARFSCYGIIQYQDAFRESYCTTFGFSRQWGRSANSTEFRWTFVPFPPYNRHT